jgi:PAS domain S-box-containing protein
MNEKLHIRVLLVEDNATDALLLREALSDVHGGEFVVTHVERLADCLARLREENFDVALLDLGLPDSCGMESFLRLHRYQPDVPVLVLTGLDDEAVGTRAMQEGAQDYLVKQQLQPSLLGRSIRYAIERKRTEERIAHQARLLDSVNDAIVASDEQFRLTFWNAAAEAMYGWQAEEVLGRNGVELLRTEFPGADPVEMRRKIAEIGGWRGEATQLRKDGTRIPVEVASIVIRDAGGRIKGYVSVNRDITDRKKNEEAMETEKERLRTIVQNMPVMMDAFDEEGNIIVWNRECELVSGYSKEEIVGNPKAMELFYPDADYRNKMTEEWRRRDNNYRDWAWDMTCKDGTVKTILWSNSSSIFPIAGWATWGIGVDISALLRAEELMRSSLKEKEVLLKEIHHRVKNNLQVISSLLKLQSRYTKDDRTLEMFEESRQRIRTMALIHEELYKSSDLARIKFASYVQNIANHLQRSYGSRSKAITVKVDIDDVQLDIDRAVPCGLIINELVTNSLKYAFPPARRAQPGRQTNAICIEMHVRDNERVALKISDNGIGLPAGLDFRHTESLGMQLVNTLADQLHGAIECRDVQGAEFTITFALPKHKDGANGTSQNHGR